MGQEAFLNVYSLPLYVCVTMRSYNWYHPLPLKGSRVSKQPVYSVTLYVCVTMLSYNWYHPLTLKGSRVSKQPVFI